MRSARIERTRVRTGGTRVTETLEGAKKIAALRSIVEERQYAKVNGCAVDLFSASAIVKVYDALSEENRARYVALSVPRMASVAFKLLGKAS